MIAETGQPVGFLINLGEDNMGERKFTTRVSDHDYQVISSICKTEGITQGQLMSKMLSVYANTTQIPASPQKDDNVVQHPASAA